jgi:hypothetical protein
VGRFLGRILGLAVWRRILLGARDRPCAGRRSIGGLDRRRPGERGGRWRFECYGAGLYSIGIPRDSIVTYETAIKAGQYLVVAHGTSAEAAKARNILSTYFEHIETNPSDRSDRLWISTSRHLEWKNPIDNL